MGIVVRAYAAAGSRTFALDRPGIGAHLRHGRPADRIGQQAGGDIPRPANVKDQVNWR
jgi:hypothetical protein